MTQYSNSRQFALDLKHAATVLLPNQLIIFHKKIAMDLLRKIVFRNPVLTGRSRGNWQAGVGTTEYSVLTWEGKTPEAVVAEAMGAMSDLRAFAVVYVWNNVAYITRLEDGYSRQAPAGMVSISVEEMRHVVQRANF